MKIIMRTILMVVLVAMGLQMQAQVQETLCDYTYTVGTQDEFEIAIPTTGNGCRRWLHCMHTRMWAST